MSISPETITFDSSDLGSKFFIQSSTCLARRFAVEGETGSNNVARMSEPISG